MAEVIAIFGLAAFFCPAFLAAWGAGAWRWLLNFAHAEFLATRERVEFTRDMVYFIGGSVGLAPAIFGFEGSRALQAALVTVTVVLVGLVGRALTRRLEKMK